MPVPRASMGFVGSVTFADIALVNPAPAFNGSVTVRATSADVKTSQDITFPTVIDGRIDRSVYQLGPRIVGGNIAFPLVHEGTSNITKPCGTAVSHGQLFWALCTQRDQFGRLQYDSMRAKIRYTDDTAFIYPACLINTLTLRVQQEGTVDMEMEVLGGANSSDNVRLPFGDSDEPALDYLAPARIVTWNDFRIYIYGDNTTTISGDYLRSFEITVNNNATRYYTLNNRLAPQDIAAAKRELSGRITVMGRHKNLSELAYNNQTRFTADSKIAFGYTLGGLGTPVFSTVLHGVVFQIEEIALTNDLVETNVQFFPMADCEASYEATEIGGTHAITSSRPAAGAFGGPTSPRFPNFRVL